MALSPNYSWVEPDNSSLVKNGAQDIRALGDAIDAFLFRPLTRNFQINGGFDNWQRSTSSATLNAYATADRWYQAGSGTVTYSRDTDVPANQGFTYSAKWLTGASSSFGEWYSALEAQDVNALAGRQVTLSYWVKSTGSFTGTISARLQAGNTANTLLSGSWTSIAEPATATPTGTWTRYSTTVNVTAGTLGLRVLIGVSSAQSSGVAAFITGVQIELGNKATPFVRSGGTIQGELAACQRYYWQSNADSSSAFGNLTSFSGVGSSATALQFAITTPVSMRIKPSSVSYSTIRVVDGTNALTTISAVTVSAVATAYQPVLDITLTGATQFRMYAISANNSTAAYIALSAEL